MSETETSWDQPSRSDCPLRCSDQHSWDPNHLQSTGRRERSRQPGWRAPGWAPAPRAVLLVQLLAALLAAAHGQCWPRTDRGTHSQDCISYAGRSGGSLWHGKGEKLGREAGLLALSPNEGQGAVGLAGTEPLGQELFCSGERKDVLGALAHGRDMSVLVLCWCQPHGKPGTGLTSLGEIQCPVVPSKHAPGSAPCGGWLCCWYQVPLISVMSGMHYAGDFSSSVSQAQECQEQRPHIVPALPHAGSAALQHSAGCSAGLEHPWGFWSILGAPGASLLQSRGMVSPSPEGTWGPGPGYWLQGARSGDAVCHGASWWMFGGEPGPGLECRDVVLSAATAPCASEGASSALEQDPAWHKCLLEPLRCLGRWLQIALSCAGDQSPPAHPASFSPSCILLPLMLSASFSLTTSASFPSAGFCLGNPP